jgi:hypothetical protein
MQIDALQREAVLGFHLMVTSSMGVALKSRPGRVILTSGGSYFCASMK